LLLKFMGSPQKIRFSGPVIVFHGRRLPELATPAGYAALIDAYQLEVPIPRILTATGEHHRVREMPGWRLLTPRHAPEPTLQGHLIFALKYEGLDLALLKRLFQEVGPPPIEAMIREAPTGTYSRRIWFLYEWLTGTALDLENATSGKYIDVVDPEQQYAVSGMNVARQRVRNNLPGTPAFCPLVFRTPTLDRYASTDLAALARAVVASVPKDLMARAAAFLLLKDSKSSYLIEGEDPPHDRMQRWARAISEAGKHPINLDELVRLQDSVIADKRFVRIGLRNAGGFVGEHDRVSHSPLPDHISARPQDLPALVDGLRAFDEGAAQQLDTVVAAAVLAFGFVYIHPFEDGNGRIHRYLIHHVLAKGGFNPPGVVFPVSAVILQRIDEYRAVLEDYSKRLLPVVRWQPTDQGDVDVLNDTGDFYRFFDATMHAEFLYSCVQQTIEKDLPEEADFLRRYDRFAAGVQAIVDMPDRTRDLLFKFVHQNGGRLSQRARTREFGKLTDAEAKRVEELYREQFEERS
jgi:hypothetical protein